MNHLLHEAKLSVLEMNQVAASICVGVSLNKLCGKNSDLVIRAEAFEVGFDGSRPDSPVAVAEPASVNCHGEKDCLVDLPLRIGTPFLWSPETQPRYAVVISAEQRGQVEHGEIQFGFDLAGQIVVTEKLKDASVASPALNSQLPSVFVVSDSTAFSNGKNQRGWGDELAKKFDRTKINVLNRARPGRSTRSFRSEGLWQRVLAELKAGDFVLIQFGHNDADKLAEDRCRGVLPGVGEETKEVVIPDGTCESVRTYGWYLRQFIAETKAKGATPILLSLTAKNLWQDGKLVRHQSDYGDWAAQVARIGGADFVDLAEIIANRYDELGREKVQPLFCSASDNVHTSPAGAELNAACVAAGLKRLPKSPLTKFLLT